MRRASFADAPSERPQRALQRALKGPKGPQLAKPAAAATRPRAKLLAETATDVPARFRVRSCVCACAYHTVLSESLRSLAQSTLSFWSC